jgi:hypothetical protein
MTDLTPLFPRQPVPPLTVPLVGGGEFDLAAEHPTHVGAIDFVVAKDYPTRGEVTAL